LIAHLPELLRQRSCFLFDLDGTLVDSSTCHERAYLEALTSRLPDLASRFSYEPCKGRRTRDALRDYGIEDEALLTELSRAKQKAYRTLVESGAVQLLPGARELLQALRLDRRLFLVTGSTARSTREVTSQLGIYDWFEQIVTADDVAEGKPAPECWLTCMERAAIRPEKALVVEDALSGIHSARAAGLKAVVVNNSELVALPEYAGTLEDILTALRA